MSELKSIGDCKNFEAGCPRKIIDDKAGFCGCDGELAEVLDTRRGSVRKNCDRWACETLEHVIQHTTKEQTRIVFELKNIVTNDGNSVEVITLTDIGKRKQKNYKIDMVFDEEGNIYFPLKDNPDLYHINRKVQERANLKTKEHFSVLKGQL